jgi:hypothetical protein
MVPAVDPILRRRRGRVTLLLLDARVLAWPGGASACGRATIAATLVQGSALGLGCNRGDRAVRHRSNRRFARRRGRDGGDRALDDHRGADQHRTIHHNGAGNHNHRGTHHHDGAADHHRGDYHHAHNGSAAAADNDGTGTAAADNRGTGTPAASTAAAPTERLPPVVRPMRARRQRRRLPGRKRGRSGLYGNRPSHRPG